MTFISFNFLIFLLITFLLYFVFPIKYRWVVLLIFSIAFYLTAGIEKIPFIIITSFVAYGAGRWIDFIYAKQILQFEDINLGKAEKKELQIRNKKKCKVICLTAVTLILLMLVYSKTGRWIINNYISFFRLNMENQVPVIVPLGISYYTFSTIGYVADVYWKKEKAEKNYFKFALFVFYFPKILQGPISRHRFLASQLLEGHTFNYNRFCNGLQLMIWGYFKKLVISDRLAILVNTVYDSYGQYSGSMICVATIFAAIVLYCDFSGCMDIASGISQVLGIDLEKNFNHPFFSKSAAEFWRRWHITLGTWFKDYIYMPLAVSPKIMKAAQKIKKAGHIRLSKAIITTIPLAVVWILTGIWHGTGGAYVVWGIYWGSIIIFTSLFDNEIKRLTKKLAINVEAHSWKIFQMVRTFLLFCIGRIITIPNDLDATITIFKSIFTHFSVWELFDGSLFTLGLDGPNLFVAVIASLILLVISVLQERGSVREMIASNNIVVRWIIYYLAIFAVIIFGIYGPGYDAGSFAYMNY